MSPTEKPNEQAPAATVPQILARLILVQQHYRLPDFVGIESYERDNPKKIDLRLADRSALDAWLAALGGDAAQIRTVDNWTWVNVWNWHGPWSVRLDVLDQSATDLDADTVAGLEEIAAVSDDEHEPTFARCERTDESECCRCRLPVDHLGGCRFVRLEAVSA